MAMGSTIAWTILLPSERVLLVVQESCLVSVVQGARVCGMRERLSGALECCVCYFELHVFRVRVMVELYVRVCK